ncbi:uncharacterized protein LOC143850041 [Tasmannia lanceolata]|uniref:uncharacterized protein LOC143850041 n=1 Tax=Tasmannia lanceolata TaxID=3420 RepID=UPI0040631064
MHKMKRRQSKKSHFWWWETHISPQNSKWLSENLAEMDKSVKQMRKLVEEAGDSFEKKSEMYYQKRPELISLVEDFYRVYQSLAERYDHVTGELRKSIRSELQSQDSNGGASDLGSEPPSPSPEHKPPQHEPRLRTEAFEFLLGSGGSSDLSWKGSDWSSSSLLESGSESDEVSSKYCLSIPMGNRNVDALRGRIIELENELLDVKVKLRESSKEGQKFVENGSHEELHAKISALEEKLIVANENLNISAEEIARLKCELDQKECLEMMQDKEKDSQEAELELEKKQVAELCEQIAVLEIDVSDRENSIRELKEEISDMVERFSQEKSGLEVEFLGSLKSLQDELVLEKKRALQLEELNVGLETDVLDRTRTIKELKVVISEAADRFSREKLDLEMELSVLLESNAVIESKFNERVTILEDEIKQLQAGESEIERIKIDRAERETHFEQLNQSLDKLTLKYELLMAERDELFADVSSKDDRIRKMDEHLQRLQSEHLELIEGSETVWKLKGEIQERVKELEEEKREVIRQLCFSIEHYRDVYYQLRQAVRGRRLNSYKVVNVVSHVLLGVFCILHPISGRITSWRNMDSKPNKVRLVRCPKCRQLLTEFADIPVYKCGGCSAVLRAKKCDAGGERNASETLEKNPVQINETWHNSKDNESITSKKEPICGSTNEIVLEERDKSRDCDKNSLDSKTNSNAVSSSSELNRIGEKVSLEIGESREESDENEGKGSNFREPGPFGLPFTAQRQSDQSFQSKTDDSSLDEQVEKSKDHGQRGSNQVSLSDRREETTKSVDDSVISEEDMANTMLGRKLGVLSKSPTNAYYGNVTYDDGRDDHVPNRHLLRSKRTRIKSQRVTDSTNTKGRPQRKTVFPNNEMGTNSEAQCQGRKFPSMPLIENYGLIKGEPSEPTRYGFKAHEQGSLPDTEEFYSARTLLDSEMGRSSSFVSRDSNYRQEELLHNLNSYASGKLEYLEHERMELLREVEELRDKLTGGKEKERVLTCNTQQESQRPYCYNRNPGPEPSYVQTRKTKERFPIRGTQIETQWPLCYNHDFGQEELQCCNTNYPLNTNRKVSCFHCYPENWNYSALLQPNICYNKGPCRACPGMCHHSCTSIPQRHMDSTFPPNFHSSQIHDRRHIEREMEKFYYKEKSQPIKRHCWPLAGGAPFVLCYRCWKVLQLPADFLLLRRLHHKLRCGSCSEVLGFSRNDRNSHGLLYSYSPTQIPHPPSVADDSTDSGNLVFAK